MLDPNGQSDSLPACAHCTHAGEKHRNDTAGTANGRCEVCPSCPGYVAMTPDFKQTPLTLGSLNRGRPPQGPIG